TSSRVERRLAASARPGQLPDRDVGAGSKNVAEAAQRQIIRVQLIVEHVAREWLPYRAEGRDAARTCGPEAGDERIRLVHAGQNDRVPCENDEPRPRLPVLGRLVEESEVARRIGLSGLPQAAHDQRRRFAWVPEP